MNDPREAPRQARAAAPRPSRRSRVGRPRSLGLPPPRASAASLLFAALSTLLLGACEVPTDTPNWEQRWVIAGDSTSMSVEELLPSSVTLTPDRSAFLVSLDRVDFRQSLGQMCADCRALQGLFVPKPGFSFTFADSVHLPDEVASVSLAGGNIEVQLGHTFAFDPLRPSASARGRLTARLVHGAATLASVEIRGEDEAFPTGTTKTRTLALPSTTIAGPIAVEIFIESPAGDAAPIDTAAVLDVRVTPRDIRVSEAGVRVTNKRVDVDAVDVDLEDVETSITNRLQEGAFVFEISNPFQVSGGLELRIQAAGRTITKALSVSPGTSTQRVQFSRDELRAMFGARNVMSASGSVSASGGVAAVRPNQILVVKTTIDIVVSIKEG